MRNIIIYEVATGVAVSRISVPDTFNNASIFLEEGQAIKEYDGVGDFNNIETEIQDGQIAFKIADPDPARELIMAKIALTEEVNKLKADKENAGCATPLGMMDSDEGSRNKLLGAIVEAQISTAQGQPFSISWTMADNVNVAHDPAQIIAAGRAVGQFINACHVKARALKQAVEQASDMAELEAINVETGWPGGN